MCEVHLFCCERLCQIVQRRLEMLGRRRLRVGYGEWTVHKTKRNADAFDTPTLLDDEVRQRGMTMPGHEDICKPERPACNNLSTMEPSASVRQHKPPPRRPTSTKQPQVIRYSNPDSVHRMSTGSLQKCCRFIILSASVISPSVVKISL